MNKTLRSVQYTFKLLLKRSCFSIKNSSLAFLTWVLFVSENDLDFAGLNHAMCDWLNVCETANQNTVKIRFHENRWSNVSLASKSTNPLTRRLQFQRQNNRHDTVDHEPKCPNKSFQLIKKIIEVLIPLKPSFLMDYRPFIYGGLASMTAEFGEIICFILYC